MPRINDLSKFASKANGVYSSVTTNATAITSISVGGTSLNSTSFPGNANSATYLGNSSGTVANIASWITGNATTAYTNATVFASNASNITTGTLPLARLDANVVNTSGNFTISGVHTHTANIDITNDRNLRFQTVNTSVYVSLRQQSDDNFVFYSSNTTGGERAVFSIYANSVTSNLIMYPSLQLTSAVVANGSNGTAGQALTSSGTGVYWATPGGSPWVYISTTNASSSSTVEVTGMNSTYDFYMITIQNMSISTSSQNFWAQMYLDGTKQTGANYGYVTGSAQTTWTLHTWNNGTDNRVYLVHSSEMDSSADFNFVIYCPNVNSTTYQKGFWGTGSRFRNARPSQFYFSGNWNATGVKLTGLSFFMQSGTINTGSFRLYGLKNS